MVDREEVARFRRYWLEQDEIEHRQRIADFNDKASGRLAIERDGKKGTAIPTAVDRRSTGRTGGAT